MEKKKKKEFSKTLLAQEAALIWIMSLSFIILAFYCIYLGFMGTLPWLTAMVGFPWTAYGVSQAFYYSKSKAENTAGGVKYESVLLEAKQIAEQYYQNANYTSFEDESVSFAADVEYPPVENINEYQI